MDTGAIEVAEARLATVVSEGDLPALARPAGARGANDVLHFTDAGQQGEAPWYRLAFGRVFAGMAGGEPRWEMAVRLIAPHPVLVAPLQQALARTGVTVSKIPWIGVPRLQINAKTAAGQTSASLRIGHSIRHPNSGNGTITLFFKMPGRHPHFLLASGHVATCLGTGKSGDHLTRVTPAGHGTWQTAPVAILSSAPASPGNAFPATDGPIFADYAIAELMPNIRHDDGRLVGRRGGRQEAILNVGPIPIPGPEIRPRVCKIGVGSGETFGEITALNVRIPILDPTRGVFVRYEKQVEIAGDPGVFSKDGDSGALVFTEDMVGVAMINGGTSKVKEGGQKTFALSFASPIEPILKTLEASVQL